MKTAAEILGELLALRKEHLEEVGRLDGAIRALGGEVPDLGKRAAANGKAVEVPANLARCAVRSLLATGRNMRLNELAASLARIGIQIPGEEIQEILETDDFLVPGSRGWWSFKHPDDAEEAANGSVE